MSATRSERIRPCVRCGALMPFSALRCGACGAAGAGAPADDDRVRPCLQCGVILRFDQDPCPQCGARAKQDEDADRIKPCAACGELIPFRQLYCSRCHQLSIPIAIDSIPPDVVLAPREQLLAAAPTVVGMVAYLTGMALLAVAAAEICT